MENPESNFKPQPTGGLKLMTVFIAVLALHVLVIGGFTVWHLLNPATPDSGLTADKSHKDARIAADTTITGDLASTDAAATDKTAGAVTPSATAPADNATDSTMTPTVTTDVAGTPAATGTPAANGATATASASDKLEPRPGPEHLMVTPPPVADDASSIAASGPTSDTPSGPIQHGPVIDPPQNLAPPADAGSTASASIDGAAPVANGTPYTVRKGDSLARIAHRHHVALAQLKLANSLTSDRLKIGQKLVIPNRAEKLAADDASEAASAPQLASSETNDSASTAPVASIAKPEHHLRAHKTSVTGHHFYTVVRGDTLIKIARRFRTTTGAIMAENGITNASRLSIGKRLRIPAGESRSAAATAREAAPVERETRTATHGQLANYVP